MNPFRRAILAPMGMFAAAALMLASPALAQNRPTALSASDRLSYTNAFDALRREDPVHWNDEPDGNKGFWSITRYNDIVDVLRDTETYSSERGTVNLEELDDEQMRVRKSMLETDGERHRALRC